MLKDIEPLLVPELLHQLARMGHGDDLAVVDANFPAESVAAAGAFGRVVQLTGVGVEEAVRAILTRFPLDDFVAHPVMRMEVVDAPDEIPPSQEAVIAMVGAARVGALERFAFYEAAKRACAVVRVASEGRPYACFLLKKGVVFF